MSDEITRRQLLQAAGGITFLALLPIGPGAFAAPEKTPAASLVYTALPYVQPGPNSKLVNGQENIILAWQTEARPANFTVEFGTSKKYGSSATVARTEPYVVAGEDEGRFNYAATLDKLNLGTTYQYRVQQDGKTVAEGYFTTRKPRGTKTRFVAFGDNSYGEPGQRAVAYHAYQARPDFIMNTGDNVYEGGQNNEYVRYFFPIYNADVASPIVGAPLLRSIPFYTCMANHDVHDKDAKRDGAPVADFDKSRDSLAYYTALHFPLNGMATPPQPTPITGKSERLDKFKAAAGDRFPRMANYSFDYGDIHFLVLDSNVYVDTTEKALHDFVEDDLSKTDARWKFVVWHHPSFNIGDDHYAEQHFRVLSPLFEKHGVDMTLHGHEHNYQRTKPFRFMPKDNGQATNLNSKDRLVPGTFTIDNTFDGVKNTKPNGIIYITTGAGGKHLYDPDFTDNPEKWLHKEDDNVPYCARVVTDRHSLTVFDVDSNTLTMTQIDQWGKEIDRIRIVKG